MTCIYVVFNNHIIGFWVNLLLLTGNVLTNVVINNHIRRLSAVCFENSIYPNRFCVPYDEVMSQRNSRQSVEDLWVSRSGMPTKLHGKGMRWRARHVDTIGCERTKRFEKKRDATEWLKDLTRSGQDIAPPVKGDWTVANQFAGWIRRPDIAETTRATRQHTWNKYVQPRWGDEEVRHVDPAGVRSWLAELSEEGARPATIENALGVLRMVLGDAVTDGRLIRNPVDGFKAPRRGPVKKHRRECYLTHQQVDQLATAVGEYGTVIRFLAYTGLRWGEMAALTPSAVDLTKRRVTVSRSIAEAGRKVDNKRTKTYEAREVPLPEFLVDELRPWMAGKHPTASFVFAAPDGGCLLVSNFRPRVFNKARDSLKDFPKITPHDLRHTCASLVVAGGGNVLVLARMLGHKDASMTLNTYADLFDSDLDALADVLGAARTKALQQPTPADANTEPEGKNVPGTQKP
ncbi:phage integrase [Mycobacteroides abscessus subsp. abscessus]|nr:phage integrase [Mycobacteroides abscessus subsp. abscessus]